MNVVVVGGGKVGSELVSTLTNDGHNVSVIEINQKVLDQLAEDNDILPLCGNGGDIDMLREAGLDNADIFIAVTPDDELNLLACLMAKNISEVKTVARVRNPVFSKEIDFLGKKLGVSVIINPEQLAADEISRLLTYPSLSRIDFLENRSIALFCIHIRKNSRFVGMNIQQIREELVDARILACAVERNGEAYIPRGSFILNTGDEVTFISTIGDMGRFLKAFEMKSRPVENYLITGGGTITYYLVKKLIEKEKHVRIIEINPKRCEELAEAFPEAEVICGDGTDKKVLQKNGIEDAEAFVALTGIDEENVIVSTYAKGSQVSKVITKVNRTDMSDVINMLNIDSVVFPKLLCADIIVQYVRTLYEGCGGNIGTLHRFINSNIEIVEFEAVKDGDITGKKICELAIKKDILIACIMHEGKIIIPSGNDTVNYGDSVVIASYRKKLFSIHEILE